jgi:hypothetical protein
VRQQSARPGFTTVTYLSQKLECGYTVLVFSTLGLVLEYLTVPPQCTGRVDT